MKSSCCFVFDVGKLETLQGKSSWKMKPVMALMCTVLLIFWYKTTNIQYEQTEVWSKEITFIENTFDMIVTLSSFWYMHALLSLKKQIIPLRWQR